MLILHRRFFNARPLCAALLSCVLLAAGAVHAQTGPQTLRLLVGFPPGGGTDAIARLLGERLSHVLGQAVVVDNRPGAGGQIAAQMLKAAPNDGSTLFLSNDHTISIVPQVIRNPGFDPQKDFVPVAGFATSVNGLVVAGATPAINMAEYVSWVKTVQAGKSTVGIPAPASIPEFLVKDMAVRFKLDLQPAPYRGSGPMIADLLGNQIAAGVGSLADFVEYQKSGKVRFIGVMGRQRHVLLPQVQTFGELGLPGLEELPYYGFFAPRGTPQAAIDRFSAALDQVLKTPALAERLTAMGLAVEFTPQAAFADRVRVYSARWEQTIRSSGYQPQ